MRATLWLVFAASLGGCVQHAVLENDVRSAQWKARTLATATDLSLAHAALSAQLVELEALYQRDRSDERIRALLETGYQLMGRGFVELRRWEAVAEGEGGRATREQQLASDAAARARYYRPKTSSGDSSQLAFERALGDAEAACVRHDRAAYERKLNALLAEPEAPPEGRLQQALLRRLASAWLAPGVAARCGFDG